MRIAWFRAAHGGTLGALDDLAPVIALLAHGHELHVITANAAHDFVWTHARHPYDLCVYEMANTSAHAFIWPYLLHYPGTLALRSSTLAGSKAPRGAAGLQVPLLASRVVAVPDTAIALSLQDDYPDARIRVVRPGVERHDQKGALNDRDRREAAGREAPLQCGLLDAESAPRVRRALARARQSGAHVAILERDSPEAVIRDADVLVALEWPPTSLVESGVLAAMAAAKPAIVFEIQTTAGWPAVDPQTWQPRGWTGSQPAVVSLDPRDEEHSLMLAMKRLAADPELRARLGRAGYDWWRAHAMLEHAVTSWSPILSEAAAVPPPPRPADWPPCLAADGTELARTILGDFGLTVDCL